MQQPKDPTLTRAGKEHNPHTLLTENFHKWGGITRFGIDSDNNLVLTHTEYGERTQRRIEKRFLK